MYSFLSPKCRVNRSNVSGEGVFAIEPFEPGELVAVWGGKIYTTEELIQLEQTFPQYYTYPVSVFPGFYLGPPNPYDLDDAEMFNHSCEANVGVRGQIVLVARRKIAANEELTFDYDTTEESFEAFQCHCGKPMCRGKIDGSGWRDPAFVARNYEFLSWYIQDLLRQEQVNGHTKLDHTPGSF